MMSMKQEGKPVSFVEDCAVPLPHLADYTERLNAIFAKHGTRGTMYAHASEGCLHVRPVLNLKLEKDVKAMRAIAEETFEMVREYKGSHSGEHGDGLVRSEFHEAMFGSRIVADFREVKQRFDPDNVLNPGKIVDPPKMDDRSLFRYPPDYRVGELKTALDWSAYPGAGGGFQGAVEMCNNNGACRKLEGGVMCPSYRATRNEKDVTRGRANTLRLAISGQLGPGRAGLRRDDGHAQTLRVLQGLPPRMPDRRRHGQDEDRGVGGARGKTRAFAARPAGRLSAALCRPRVPLRPARQLAQQQSVAAQAVRDNSPASARNAPCPRSGATCSGPMPRPSGRKAAARSCCLPTPSTASMSGKISTPRCACWSKADTASISQDPAIAPGRCVAGGHSSRPAWSIRRARELDRLVATYAPFAARGVPIVGLEPSCLLTLRDELLSLRSDDDAKSDQRACAAVRGISGSRGGGRPPATAARRHAGKALVHGHCHQKSFGAFKPVEKVLRLIPDLNVETIESSCCGMAGAFGYGADTYQASMEMAELSLLPAVRRADQATLIVADGTSCRHQIKDGTERSALHVARVLAMSLDRATTNSHPLTCHKGTDPWLNSPSTSPARFSMPPLPKASRKN